MTKFKKYQNSSKNYFTRASKTLFNSATFPASQTSPNVRTSPSTTQLVKSRISVSAGALGGNTPQPGGSKGGKL